MCGRATLTLPVDEVAEILGVSAEVKGVPVPGPPPRFNLAPTQSMLVLRRPRRPEGDVTRELAWARWGLVPFWAKDLKVGARFLQARAETVDSSSAFKRPFAEHRCALIVDGFYEWSHPLEGVSEGRKAAKVPHLVRPASGGLLALAGVWERWTPPVGTPVESCAVITTAAGPRIAQLHDRMPLVLRPHELAAWLDGSTEDAAAIVHDADVSALGVARREPPRLLEKVERALDLRTRLVQLLA